MSAENPSDTHEVTTESNQGSDDRRKSTVWAQLITVLIGAIVMLIVLTQCVPHVPDVRGLSEAQARSTLAKAGYKVGNCSRVELPGTPAGKVGEQAPDAGSVFAKGRPIDLVVAVGNEMVKVPDAVGSDTPAAELAITRVGLVMDTAGQYSPTIPPGAILSQDPVAGTTVRAGSEVAVIVSMGIAPEPSGGWGTSSSGGARGASTDQQQDANVSPLGCTASYPGASVWSSGGDISIRLSAGGATRQLTSGPGWDTNPLLSPSAKYVVFMRAPSSGARADQIGRVCLTTFESQIVTMPVSLQMKAGSVWYPNYAFGPSPTGTTADSDWLVISQMYDYPLASAEEPDMPLNNTKGRITVCNVPLGSTWVAWNLQFFQIDALSLSRSSKAGCVKVTARRTNGEQAVRDFNVYSGLYLK